VSINDRILLQSHISDEKGKVAEQYTDSQFFELFAADQILKDFDLSWEQIVDGNPGGASDAGIDGFYTFINNELVEENPDFTRPKDEINIRVVIIQAKYSQKYDADVVHKIIVAAPDIFNIDTIPPHMDHLYNPKIRELILRFKRVYKQIGIKLKTLNIEFYYCNLGMDAPSNWKSKTDQLKNAIHDLLPRAKCNAHLWGASELLDLARRSPLKEFKIRIGDTPFSLDNETGFIALVNLYDYYRFITDDDTGHLRQSIFEANVRDYQGENKVNKDIQNTLEGGDRADFWWLNNGVTILSSNVQLRGKRELLIASPEIVNGLQTSFAIYKYFSSNASSKQNEERNILIRVLVPNDESIRDRIIRATNWQTPIQEASLRATDKIHRDIEEHFKYKGLYYDRRKNFYKNQGKPIKKIITILGLAQAVMATLLQRPDDARGRPSDLLKDDEYDQLFSDEYPLDLYFFVATLYKHVDEKVRYRYFITDETTRNKARQIMFHIMLYAVVRATHSIQASPVDISKLTLEDVPDALLNEAIETLVPIFDQLGGDNRAAKGHDLKNKTLQHLQSLL
jgi:hypothetical protein